jgi:predicted nuclease of predicted toxin-antitoxin system
MIARLYSNENFPLPAVAALRQLGHDVRTTLDEGKSHDGVPDEEVLPFAIENERAVITHNRHDFIRLHRENPDHPGIIVCTDNPDFEALAARVHEQLEMLDCLKGKLIRVNRGSGN